MCKVSWSVVLLSLFPFVTICMRIIFTSWHENQMLVTNYWLTEEAWDSERCILPSTSSQTCSNIIYFVKGCFYQHEISLSHWVCHVDMSCFWQDEMWYTALSPWGIFFSSWARQLHKVLSDCDHSGEKDKWERACSHTQDRKQLRKTRKHTTQNGALTLYSTNCTSHV